VVEAAFAVLRELCLRSGAGDAPKRLAQLNAAHLLLTRRSDSRLS
jgi:hypothetical protein